MTFDSNPNYYLRSTLALVGTVIIFLGLNVSLGGIQTLGWQGGNAPFLTITDATMFSVRDNHVRFIGGVWLSLGALMLAGAIAFQRLRTVLVAFTGIIFIGGLARFSAGDPALLLTSGMLPSVIFELAIAPLLGWWFTRAERHTARS